MHEHYSKLGKGGDAQVYICKEIEEMLKTSGRSWEVRQGSRHNLLYIEGRMVTIFPKSQKRRLESHQRAKNNRAEVKRALRSLDNNKS